MIVEQLYGDEQMILDSDAENNVNRPNRRILDEEDDDD